MLQDPGTLGSRELTEFLIIFFSTPIPGEFGAGLSTQPGRPRLNLGSQAGPGSRVAALTAAHPRADQAPGSGPVLRGSWGRPGQAHARSPLPQPAQPLTWLRPAAGGEQRGAQHRAGQQQRDQRRARTHAACRLPRGAALLGPRCRAGLLRPAPARARPARQRPLHVVTAAVPLEKAGLRRNRPRLLPP